MCVCVCFECLSLCVSFPFHFVISFNYPAKSTEAIEADHHLKLVFTFELVNSKTGDAVSVHQVLNCHVYFRGHLIVH